MRNSLWIKWGIIGPNSIRLINSLLSTFLTGLFHPENKLNHLKCIKNFYIIDL
jgi:hypothetical protein